MDIDDDVLIEQLQEEIRQTEEWLRRRKAALAALKGKGTKSARTRGLRPGSIPALALAALKGFKQPVSLDDLTTHLKKANTSLDARKVSIALSRYVRLEQHFAITEEGKYGLK